MDSSTTVRLPLCYAERAMLFFQPLRAAALGLLFVSLGCGSKATDDRLQIASLSAGDITLSFDGTVPQLELFRGDERLLLFEGDGFQIGEVDALDSILNYDPWRLAAEPEGYEPTESLIFHTVESGRVDSVSDTAMDLDLLLTDGSHATLHLEVLQDEIFSGRLTPLSEGALVYLRLSPTADAEEAFYGLGEYFDQVNHRGKIRPMQLSADPTLESFSNEAHVPVPFVVGTRGWGLFVESPYPGAFDIATDERNRVEATFSTTEASSDGLPFYLFAADHPLDVTKLYYELTGYPAVPAPWALGPWMWRNENRDEAQVLSDINQMRDLDLPHTGVLIDRPYASAVNTFDFSAEKFTDAQGMIDEMHRLGFRVAIWHTPYLDENRDAAKALRDYATEQGYFPPKTGIRLNSWSDPLDLTNPECFAWWQGQLQTYMDMGIEGFKLDFAEDIVPGVFAARTPWAFADGSDERTMHSRYQEFYHRLYAELLPEDGGFMLARGGTYGDQVNVRMIWPGDLDGDFSYHGESIIDKDGDNYFAVGGLPASLIAGLSLGPSGFPFYGADTGGFRHTPPSKEVFIRWFQQTSLSTVMQIGVGSSDVVWEPTMENGWDTQTLDLYRQFTRLHLRLFPYLWTYAQKLADDGRPIQRALGLAYPELGVHPNDTYMFGDDLLVAPVLRGGVTEREVMFPEGRWVNWFDGSEYQGEALHMVPASLETLPLFLRAGGIVPLLRPTIDTTAPAEDTARVDSMATTAGLLYPRIVPGPASSFTVYDGSTIEQARTGNTIELRLSEGSEFVFGTVCELLATSRPASVTLDTLALVEAASMPELEAASQGWYFDLTKRSLYVKSPPGDHEIQIAF